MKRQVYYILMSVLIATIDLLSKNWVVTHLKPLESRDVIGEIVRFKLVLNGGIIFGIFNNQINAYVILAMKLTIITGLIVLFSRLSNLKLSNYRLIAFKSAIVLIIGGLLGNMIDRLVNNLVVDFIIINVGNYSHYIFNLADTFLFIGAVIFFINLILILLPLNR